jgi:hypothetical protein
VTAEMRLWYVVLDRHAYGRVPPTGRRSVARTGPIRRGRRCAWPQEDSEEPRGAAHGEAPQSEGGLSQRVGADAEVASARDVAALRRSGRQRVDVTVFEPQKLQFFE